MDSKKKKIIYSLLGIALVVAVGTYANYQQSKIRSEDSAYNAIIEKSDSPNNFIIKDFISGAKLDEQTIMSRGVSLDQFDNTYILKIYLNNADLISEGNFFLKTDKDKTATKLLLFDDNDSQRKRGFYELWFEGEPSTSYELIFKKRGNNKNPIEYSINFTTPSRKPNLNNITEETEKNIGIFLHNDNKKELIEALDDYADSIWSNIAPYYKPSEKDKKAIVEAYWETFIKDWKGYTLEMERADSSEYEFHISYQWAEPDMDYLNQVINNREDELKNEVGSDYKKMFQTIVKELPDMIKKTPRKEYPQTFQETVSLKRNRFQNRNGNNLLDYSSTDFTRAFNPLTYPLQKIYP